MALTVVVTRDVTERFRGFLASTMLEVAPAVYISPQARGNRAWITAPLAASGPIPAGAGESRRSGTGSRTGWAYPRRRGGISPFQLIE